MPLDWKLWRRPNDARGVDPGREARPSANLLRGCAFFIVACAIFSGVLIGGAVKERGFLRRLADSGVATVATVLDAGTRPGSRGAPVPTVAYSYKDFEGTVHMFRKDATGDLAAVGSSFPLTYVATEPNVHAPFRVTPERADRPLEEAIVAALCLVGFPLFLRVVLRRALTSRTSSSRS